MDVLLIVLIWTGASAAVLSGRRRIAGAGVGLAAVAAGALLALHGAWLGGVLLAAGGLVGAGAAASRAGRDRALLPPGSAPVITLCVVVGALSAWVGGSIIAGPGGPAGRTAALILAGLGGARLVAGRDPDGVLAPIALTALGLGLAAGFAG